MKKLLCLLMLLVLMLPAAAAEADWLEISENGELLTVRLAYDAAQGEKWNSYVLEHDVVELLTQEETDGMWVASFASLGEATGDALIRLICDHPEQEKKHGVDLYLTVDEAHKLTVNNTEAFTGEPRWYWLGEDGTVTFKLPAATQDGYDWQYEIADEQLLEVISAAKEYDGPADMINGLGSTYTAQFRMLKPGSVQLKLNYMFADDAEPLASRLITLTLDESGALTLSVDEIINTQIDMVQLAGANEKTADWYEFPEHSLIKILLPVPFAGVNVWTYEISDPEMLELETLEAVTYEAGNGAYGMYFRALAPGEVLLTVSNAGDEETSITDIRKLKLTITEGLLIEVQDVLLSK